MSRKITCAVLTNVPVPYRLAMWDALARQGDIDLHVIYCAEAHIDPTQDGRQTQGYTSHFLSAPYQIGESNFGHADWGVTRVLSGIRPDVVVTTGFIWTYLFGFLWTRWRHVPHVTLTDGTAESEASLSRAHRVVRRLVFAGTKAFVGASEGSWRLYAQYGVPRQRFFKAALCIHNARFVLPDADRPYDLLFSARLIPGKSPLFAIDVARAASARLGRKLSLRVLGKGPMEAEMREHARLAAAEVDVTFSGHLPQSELPQAYRSAKVFLFPTRLDTWGVVANEACAAGTVCVVSPHAGAANELVLDGETGQVCELSVELWADRVARLLADPALWTRQSQAAQRLVQDFNFDNAAEGMRQALHCACG